MHTKPNRKEFPLGEKKILLSRVKGEYHATSHLCPHAKAQLSKGILAHDGRLMWLAHILCFFFPQSWTHVSMPRVLFFVVPGMEPASKSSRETLRTPPLSTP